MNRYRLLAARWRMNEGNENNENIVPDDSGFGRNGQLVNMDTSGCWVDGVKGKALSFDGSEGYAFIQDPGAAFDLDSAFTISLWARANSLEMGDGWFDRIALMGKGRSGYEWPTWNLYAKDPIGELGAGQRIMFSFNEEEGWAYSDAPMEVDEWYHIAVTWGGDRTPVRMYINGELQANYSGSYSSTFQGSSEPLYIGCGALWGGPRWHFNGHVTVRF